VSVHSLIYSSEMRVQTLLGEFANGGAIPVAADPLMPAEVVEAVGRKRSQEGMREQPGVAV
jgi:hypothetical protein